MEPWGTRMTCSTKRNGEVSQRTHAPRGAFQLTVHGEPTKTITKEFGWNSETVKEHRSSRTKTEFQSPAHWIQIVAKHKLPVGPDNSEKVYR